MSVRYVGEHRPRMKSQNPVRSSERNEAGDFRIVLPEAEGAGVAVAERGDRGAIETALRGVRRIVARVSDHVHLAMEKAGLLFELHSRIGGELLLSFRERRFEG